MSATVPSLTLVRRLRAPLIMLIGQLPDAAQLGSAFAVGGGAQRVLLAVLRRIVPPEPSREEGAA